MKTLRLFSLFFVITSLFATSIEFGNHAIFYGIGQDTFSGYWSINKNVNNFSGQHIGSFGQGTQLWLLHDAVTIYVDEGDSVLSYDYHIRYYPQEDPAPAWRAYYPVMGAVQQHVSGFWYSGGSLDLVPLFTLPMDTGDYYLEFEKKATVVGIDGDTLTRTCILPDSADFKARFSILPESQNGSEQSTPIECGGFSAECVPRGVLLSWTTESETENSHFMIYRDGEIIAQVEGNGTTTEQHEYSYLDPRVQTGNHEYILSHVSFSGVETKQAPVNIEIESDDISADFILNKAYPNPFNPSVTLSMEYGVGSNIVLNIYNSQGVLVDELVKGFVEAGYHEVIWDASGMPSGIYFVVLKTENERRTKKIVLMK